MLRGGASDICRVSCKQDSTRRKAGLAEIFMPTVSIARASPATYQMVGILDRARQANNKTDQGTLTANAGFAEDLFEVETGRVLR